MEKIAFLYSKNNFDFVCMPAFASFWNRLYLSYPNSKLSSGITRLPPFRPDPLDQFSFVLNQLLTWKPTINYITKFKILNLSNFNTNFNTNVGTFILSNSGKQTASPGSPSHFCHPTAGQCIPYGTTYHSGYCRSQSLSSLPLR